MSSFCAIPANAGLAGQLLADADCHAFGLVEQGYTALAAPGGAVSAGLSGLMVLAVAFFGYRLLLGRGLMLSDAVSLAVKIGVVLVIATSWSSWQALAYDLFAHAPMRIAADVLGSVSARDPIEQLQQALDGLEQASIGYRTRAGIASPLVGGPAASAMTLTVSSLILAQSIAGTLVIARVILAILLAIAPVMAGFILFDATRGVAGGWLVAMATAALAPLFVLTTAAVEFAILLPLIARNLAEQAQGVFAPASVTPIGLVTLVFAVAMLASVYAGARIASGIKLPDTPIFSRAAPGALPETAQARTIRTERLDAPNNLALALERSVRREQATALPRFASARVVLAGATVPAVSAGPAGRAWPSANSPTLSRPPRGSRAAKKRDT